MATDSGRIAFFLGAGASVKAGVPTTIDFVAEFKKKLKGEDQLFSLLSSLIERLERWQKHNGKPIAVDVELLLGATQKIINASDELSFALADTSTLDEFPSDAIVDLQQALKDFIKERTIVDRETVRYLGPLLSVWETHRPLEVFTTNYDTSIEQLCTTYECSYTDGFADKWRPELLDSDGFEVRLYKLHGSVTWYRSDRGAYLKIPIRSQGADLTLVTGEQASPVLEYPGEKPTMISPILALHALLKQRLEKLETVYVVGYSFRDDHIRDIFSDAALANPSLRIVLIDPYAEGIFRHRLSADAAGYESPLVNRVFRVPALFEEWVRDARWRVETFARANRMLSEALISRRDFGSGDWHGVLGTFEVSDLPFFSDLVLPYVRSSGFRARSVLRLAWRKLVYDIALGTAQAAIDAIARWEETLDWLKGGVEVKVSKGGGDAILMMTWNPTNSDSIEGRYIAEEIGDWIDILDEYSSRVGSSSRLRLTKLKEYAEAVKDSYKHMAQAGTTLEVHLGIRGITDTKELAELRSHRHDYVRGESASDRDALEVALTTIEKGHVDKWIRVRARQLLNTLGALG